MAVAVDQGEKLPSGGYEVTHGTRVMAIDGDDEAPMMWDQDVSQAQLAHDVTMFCSTKDDAPHAPCAALLSPAGDPDVHPQPVARACGTSARCRSAPTRSASSSASSSRSGWGSGAGSPAAAQAGEVSDLAIWAVPFGLVGGRLYHVITDWQLYFGEGKNPVTALYVWRGGLGIWGAIALGIVGVWIGARLRGIKLLPLLDALAPGVLVAQALGRWGNWFNQELYGRPTDLPWGLEIDVAHRPVAATSTSRPSTRRSSTSACGTWPPSPC